MKKTFSKKLIRVLAVVTLLFIFGTCALASSESETTDQGGAEVAADDNKNNLGNYNVVIKSCRLAEDFDGNPIAIITYSFTNNSKNAASFMISVDDNVYQNGVGLNECYFVDDSANYSADNQTKDIKTGVTLDVEVAYTLNDTTSDLEVEVKEFISFNNSVVKKVFELQ